MKNIYDDSGNNNEPDYENNLAFPPQEIKSQDDLNRDDGAGRTMTLLRVIEQLEKTEVELEKAEKKLKIAVEALSWYDGLECMLIDWELATGQKKGSAKQALEQIKELDK